MMKKQTFSTAELTMIGMYTALLAVLSIVQIPMPSGVPITLQTFAVSLCGYCLGRRNGTLCILLYLLLGVVGVPVFTGMTGGVGKLFGFTGGFLYGFLFLAFACGLGSRMKHQMAAAGSGLAGLLICHLLGSFHYSVVASAPDARVSFAQAFLLVSAPYLVKDVLSVIGALLVSLALKKTLARGGIALQKPSA
ncbi:MAG: biotin transporter BioY [Eubacteriales bacterium]|nr:biotin transporter BioY [Eubacteriales bacterium]